MKQQAEHSAFAGVKMAQLSGVVIRCGCTAEQKAAPDWHAAQTPPQPCPRPRSFEDRGTMAYWHRNPLRRLVWRIFG